MSWRLVSWERSPLLLFSRSVVSNSFVTPQTVAHQAPLSVGFSRQEYCSELPFPPPGGLPDPGLKPASPVLAGGFFTTEPPGKPWMHIEGRGYILPVSMFPIHSSFSHPFSNYLLCITSMPSILIGIYRDTSVSEIKITPSWHSYFSRSELHVCQVAFSGV